MKKTTEIFFSIQNADAEKRLVSGVSDSGEPNGSGLLLDYKTSKPILQAWSEGIEQKTKNAPKGPSKGVLREMHKLENVGKIVSLEFDDEAEKILVTVYVSDDKVWEKVQGGEYTGFSWWWRTQGMPWRDEVATTKYGRPIYRYTGKPIELSIVDAACVPGSDFTEIQNADFPEEENDMDPTETDPKPDETPEAPPVQDIKNGVYTAGRLGECVETLAYIQRAIATEEGKEGDSAEIPAELKSIVQDLAGAWAKYSAAQAVEIAGGEGVNVLSISDEDDVMNGDYPGHAFRGNQYGGGRGSADHNLMSSKAHEATKHAEKTGNAYAHEYAKAHHVSAANLHAKAGNKGAAAYHKGMAEKHGAALSEHSKKISESVASLEKGIKTSSSSLKASGKWMTKEGDAAHFAERGRLYAIHAKEMDEAHNVHIKNSEGDTMSADDILNAEKPDALAALEARLAALEGACEVKNAEEPTGADLLADLAAQHAPAADVKNADKPETKLAVVTKDEDNGVNVKNAEAQTRAEAERIAALPESDRAAAIAAKIFGAVAR